MSRDSNGPPSATSTSSAPAFGDPPATAFGELPQERADAARNRQRILDAAARLFAEYGVGRVSMDAVAQAAGVGKGTLFRRFGDKSGLAVALLDSSYHRLQQNVESGPPPLGPGAPAADRILAFLFAYRDMLEVSTELLVMSETASPGARYRVSAYRFWHHHIATLLHEHDPDLDAVAVAHALFAPLSADLYSAQRDDGLSGSRIVAAVTRIACGLLGLDHQSFLKEHGR